MDEGSRSVIKMKKFAVLFVALLVSPTLFGLWVLFQIPSEAQIKGCLVTKMFKVDLCPKGKNYVSLKNISPYMQKTVILTEDSSFWQHGGFDWESIKKNYEENKKIGAYKRGGSTISQQLSKNMFLTAEKTLIRKGLEALITIKIERVLTKKEILERYLNVIEFGKNIYGIKAATQHYFQKHPRDLSVVESAFLAMVLPNPKKYAVSFYKKELTPFAEKRMRQIIDNMYQHHRINESEYHYAIFELETFFRPDLRMDRLTEESSSEFDLTLDNLEIEASEEDRF